MRQRVERLRRVFKRVYGGWPEVVVRSPGRAEIIGNHTDYNLGLSLSCAIEASTLVLLRRRDDDWVVVRTTMAEFKDQLVRFRLGKMSQIKRSERVKWGNYVKAVVRELRRGGYKIGGADVLIDSDFSCSGGLSSSAALELGVGLGMVRLCGGKIDRLELAWLGKRAENSDLVQSPCGFLDQGTISFAEKGKFVLLDYLPPVKHRLVKAGLSQAGWSWLVVVDKQVKRLLGESGYPARRRMCQRAGKRLGIKSLRQLSVKEFEKVRGRLDMAGGVMAKRVEHVVRENQRVRLAVKALRDGNFVRLGELINQSGKSALDLYGLDEKTPELRWLMELAQSVEGVAGARNMGGGFSVIVLCLVRSDRLGQVEKELGREYLKVYNRKLEFVKFEASDGLEVL